MRLSVTIPRHPPQRKLLLSPSFTLVEILVVISIIGLLAGLGFPAVTGAIKAGKRAEVSAMAESVKTALNAFYAEYSTYPTNSSGQVFTKTDSNFLTAISTTTTNFGNYRGISFFEVPPKFTNAQGLVTPRGFYSGTNQSNFSIAIDLQGAGTNTITVGTSSYTSPATVSVWVPDPNNPNKPLGTFK